MTRDEIINVFLVRAARSEREEISEKLYRMTKGELETAYQALQIQAAEEKLLYIQAERAADAALYQLHQQQIREPQRKAEAEQQEKQDRQTFADAAKTLRSFGLTEANFNVCRTTLGEGFSVYQIQQMLAANGAILSGPTQEEQQEWTRQDIEDHNQRLLNSDLPTLRRLTREEGARIAARVLAGPLQAAEETQRLRAAERVEGTTYLPLPEEFRDGNGPLAVLDASFIKRCSRETFRILKERYGMAQIDEALRTRRSDASPLW
jgi:hypothetical protein